MTYWREDDVEMVVWNDLQHWMSFSFNIQLHRNRLADVDIPPCNAGEKHNQDGEEFLLLVLRAVATVNT